MKRYFKVVLSAILMVCLLVGAAPDAFVNAASDGVRALAEGMEAAQGARAQSGEMDRDGWRYRVCADGNVELLGYADGAATSLTLPTALEGRWVVRVAEGAFAENGALRSVTVPAQIGEIPDSAFPNCEGMTVRAYNGTAALAFARRRGFREENRSEFDFFDDVLDLSEMSSSQWGVGGGAVEIGAPYSLLIGEGKKVYLPPRGEYANGMPVTLSSCHAIDGGVKADCAELGFEKALRSYRATGVQMAADVGGIQVLGEGVTLNARQARSSASAHGSIPLKFEVNVPLNDAVKVTGSVEYTPNITVSVDYDSFHLNEFSYENKSKTSFDLTLQASKEWEAKRERTVDFVLARVPMASATLLSLNLVLSAELSVSGEITINQTLETTVRFSYKNGALSKSRTFNNKGLSISAAADFSADLKGAAVVSIGFTMLNSYLDVAEISASYGGKVKAQWDSEEALCADINVSKVLSVSASLGLLKSGVLGSDEGDEGPLFSAELFRVEQEVGKFHFELPDAKFVDKCTRNKQVTVRFYLGYEDATAPTEVTVQKGEMVERPIDPVRDGYNFEGWYSDRSYTQPWVFETDTVEEDTNLYAQWSEQMSGEESARVPGQGGAGATGAPPKLLSSGNSLSLLTYDVLSDGIAITGHIDLDTLPEEERENPVAITIPEEIGGIPVVEISPWAFWNWYQLVQIVLPDSIERMGREAFWGTSITSIRTPKNWRESGWRSSPFDGALLLTSAVVPEGVTELPKYAFGSEFQPGSTGLRRVQLPKSLTKIGACAFYGCDHLESITLPDGVTSIGMWAFTGTAIRRIRTPKSWKEILPREEGERMTESPFVGCSTLKTIVVPEGVTELPDVAFGGGWAGIDPASITSVQLPKSLKKIGVRAFASCRTLQSIALPDGITTIGAEAFYRTGLSSIRMPKSWAEVAPCEEEYRYYRYSPFSECELQTVEIPEGATQVPAYAFEKVGSLTSVTLPSTLRKIGNHAFCEANLQGTLALPDGLTDVGCYAFAYNEGLTDITLPDSIVRMGADAFGGTTIRELRTPRSWREVYEAEATNYGVPWHSSEVPYICSPFAECNMLEHVEVPEGVTELPEYALGCEAAWLLRTISLPSTLKKIDRLAIFNTFIYEITIPASVTEIEEEAFSNSDWLKEITFQSDVKLNGEYIFRNVSPSIVYVPADATGVIEYFQTHHPETEISIVSGEMYTVRWMNAGDNPMSSCQVEAGAKVDRPADPTRSGYVFTGWYRDEACEQPWNFDRDEMPDSDLTLYAGWSLVPVGFTYALNGGSATLTGYLGSSSTVEIPAQLGGCPVTEIGPDAIPGGVLRLTIPGTVERIDAQAFRQASGLISFEVAADSANFRAEDGVLFKGSALVAYPQGNGEPTYAVPGGVTEIGERAFYNCDALQALEIPAGVGSLGAYAVYDCDNLSSVHFAQDPGAIGDGNFLICARELNVTGPVGAEHLSAYADAAHVSYNLYHLTFVRDGEYLAVVTVRAGAPIGELPQLESGEKAFLGWSAQEDGSELWAEAAMPARDVALYAVIRYPFAYEPATGGVKLTRYTGSAARVQVPEEIDGAPVVEIAADCFPDKQTVLAGNKGSVTERFAGAQGMRFEALVHTLSFETNGGRKVAPQSHCATEAIELPSPERTGFTLEGWYADASLTERWTDGVMPGHDLTLYARWTRVDPSAPIVFFTYDETGEGAVITGFLGDFGRVEVPETINGLPVVGIADSAFEGDAAMRVVTLPASVTRIGAQAFARSAVSRLSAPGVEEIGARAFDGCVSLASVDLGAKLTSIGEYAFQDCEALLEIRLPDGVAALNEGAFSGCEWLTKVQLSANLETVASGAFRDCRSLEAITLGANVREVAQDAFDGCAALRSFEVAGQNLYYKAEGGALLNASGTRLMLYPQGKADAEYALPDGVTSIADGAMRGARLKVLRLGARTTGIGADALRGCTYLERIEFNAQLAEIGENAFEGCINLTDVTLPDSVERIGSGAFRGTGLTRIRIPAQAQIGADAIPSRAGLTIYGAHGSGAETYAQAHGIRFVDAEKDVEVTDISLPESLNLEVGESAELTATLQPAGTTETRVAWSSGDESVATVRDGRVEGKGAGSTVIRATAANGAFAECAVTVKWPRTKATDILLSETEVHIAVGERRPVYATVLPAGAEDAAVTWAVEDSRVADYVDGCVVGVGVGNTRLTATTEGGLSATCEITVTKPAEPMGTPDFTLPSALTDVGEEAFAGAQMQIVSCPDGLKSIGKRAFANCAKLEQIYIPPSVTDIAGDAFEGCGGELTIYGASGTAAERFAQAHGFAFMQIG